eukprot:scaffold14276_cov75-Attheya_sp.AAC.2
MASTSGMPPWFYRDSPRGVVPPLQMIPPVIIWRLQNKYLNSPITFQRANTCAVVLVLVGQRLAILPSKTI